jgi:proteic killer suppression protein
MFATSGNTQTESRHLERTHTIFRFRSKLGAQDTDKIARILARLHRSRVPQDMAVPGFRLHPLKGELQGFWAMAVSGNWRVIFRFEGDDAADVDLVDYH